MERLHATDPMQSLQRLVDPWIRDKQAKLAAMAEAHASAHAERMAGLPPGTCEMCYGTGFAGEWGRCPQCQPSETWAPGVPYEFRECRLDNYREQDGNKSALVKARAFLDGTRDLYLTGGVGAGKTRLACSILNELHTRGKGTEFLRVPMLLHQMQPGRNAGDIADLEHRLFTVPTLVLDDVGAERDQATDYTRRTLLMVYEERGDRQRRTIWTSNKRLQELGAMQDDDRLASRIAGRADVVMLNMPDQRMAQRRYAADAEKGRR